MGTQLTSKKKKSRQVDNLTRFCEYVDGRFQSTGKVFLQ